MPYGYGAGIKHHRSMKIKHFIKSAVNNTKGFIVNKISSKVGFADLVSNFGATNVSGADTGVIAKLLDKSPFAITKTAQQEWKDRDRLGFKHIQYPQELTGNEIGNWMLFFMISNAGGHMGTMMDLKVADKLGYDAGWEENHNYFKSDKTEQSGAQFDKIRAMYAAKGVKIPDVNVTNHNLPQAGKRLVTGAVALYMPPDIKVKYSQEWAPESTETSGDLANLIKRVHEKAPTKDENIVKMIGQHGFGLALRAFKTFIGATTETLGLGDITKVYGKHKGYALNTHKEQFYEGPTFREFQYTFQFWPRNKEETKAAQDIILMFKYHMHPWKDASFGDRLFRVPSEFEIHYLTNTGRNTALPRISRCALKSVDVSYTPEGGNFKTFDDHAPVSYTLDLNFVELEFMTKDKIADGY